MVGLIRRATISFQRPFSLPGLDEMLSEGDYEVEVELSAPSGHLDPVSWKASVVVRLHPRASHPGLERSLTVSLIDLDLAHAKDKMSGKDLTDLLLEDMLADPMIRLVMLADGVSEAEVRRVYGITGLPDASNAGPG